MGKCLILNASPRAPRSNSKKYAEIFSEKSSYETEYAAITRSNHLQLCERLPAYSDVVLVFPLYADGIPVTLLNFFKTLEANPPREKPVVSVIINCGFLEPAQNDIAVSMVRLFCKQNGYRFGSVLKIGSGEAILDTPFKRMVVSKIKKFAASIADGQYRELQTTMPLSKRLFIRASTRYWVLYGQKNGVSKEEMQTMKIENQ